MNGGTVVNSVSFNSKAGKKDGLLGEFLSYWITAVLMLSGKKLCMPCGEVEKRTILVANK